MSRTALGCRCVLIIMIAVLAPASVAATEAPTVHPLEPPDRSSPRATLTTFLDSIDRGVGAVPGRRSRFR